MTNDEWVLWAGCKSRYGTRQLAAESLSPQRGRNIPAQGNALEIAPSPGHISPEGAKHHFVQHLSFVFRFASSSARQKEDHHQPTNDQERVRLHVPALHQAQGASDEFRCAGDAPHAEAGDDPTIEPVSKLREAFVRDPDEAGVNLIEVEAVPHRAGEDTEPGGERVAVRFCIERPGEGKAK